MLLAAAAAETGGGGGSFDPLSIAWDLAFWAEDPSWTNPGDGNAVSQWDDASGNGLHLTQGTGSQQPTYRASTAAFNGQPTVEFAIDWMSTAGFTAIATGDVFCVASSETSSFVWAGNDGSHRWDLLHASSGNFALHNGGSYITVAGDTDPHAIRATYDSTDVLNVDGTDILSGNAGTHSLDGLYVGRYYFDTTNRLAGHIAFLGIIDGGLTAQERSDLLAWSQSHYGTP